MIKEQIINKLTSETNNMKKSFRIKREYVIGLTVLIVFILFLWGVSFLKSDTFFHKRIEYIGVYSKANGLLVDNQVLINGIRVGKVKELGLMKNNKVYVNVAMLKKIDVPANSSMRIMSSDLLGAKTVEIILGDSKKLAQSGDTLETGTNKSLQEEVSMQVLPIKRKAEELLSSFDSLINSMQAILNAKSVENLKSSFESIRITMNNLEQTSYNVDTLVLTEKSRMKRILENIESISGNLKFNNTKLTNVINNFSTISDSVAKVQFSKTINKIDKTLGDFELITNKINKGKGSIGLLVNNDSLYKNLSSSSGELSKLLEDMRLNPKRYVHFSLIGGGNKSKYKPPQPDTK